MVCTVPFAKMPDNTGPATILLIMLMPLRLVVVMKWYLVAQKEIINRNQCRD